jgi:class 3 adenylate cyclase
VAPIIERNARVLQGFAVDNLQPVLEAFGADAAFVFMLEDGSMLVSSEGVEAPASAIAKELAPHVQAVEQSSAFYLKIQDRIFEVVVATIVSGFDGERRGFVALFRPWSPPATRILQDGTPLELGMRLGHTGQDGQEIDAALQQVAFSRTVVERPRAQLVATTSLQPIALAERTLLWRAAVAAAAALAVGLMIALYLARTLSRPIADMSAAARAIESGDYSVRVRAAGKGELGALSERFNAMSAGLALRDQYRRVLDAVTDPEVAKELLAGKLDLGGRSQEVGVLFCDIRGFTPLTEHMAPAQVIQLLNEHMSLLTGVAYAHGGVVDKFVGDLIMVTFGTPKPAADDARRMAACALAMIDARARANAAQSAPIHIGIGCAFGTVVAGCMGSERRLDYTVLGARVNLAARLCSKAPSMQVYIDDQTRMRNPTAHCTALEPLDAKGFSRPILAYRMQATGEHA